MHSDLEGTGPHGPYFLPDFSFFSPPFNHSASNIVAFLLLLKQHRNVLVTRCLHLWFSSPGILLPKIWLWLPLHPLQIFAQMSPCPWCFPLFLWNYKSSKKENICEYLHNLGVWIGSLARLTNYWVINFIT